MKPYAVSEARRLELLTPPTGKCRVVLDTDTYNEIDDQFAVVYSLLAPEKIQLEGLYAAPFHNNRSDGPGDGMEKSYEEILRVLDRLGHDHVGLVHRGSTSYLPGAEEPVDSDAARDLISKAMQGEDPLYVLAVGAITNVASALLLEPTIAGRIVVVWLGGNPTNWPSAREFNLMQDLHASRVVFDCGVPLVHIPCRNVSECLRTTLPEMKEHVKGRGAIGDYLYQIYEEYVPDQPARSKVIWDISAVAWVLNASWVPTYLTHSPILTDGMTWSRDDSRHLVREAFTVNRDGVFGDLFARLRK